jgi:hypothetical protein
MFWTCPGLSQLITVKILSSLLPQHYGTAFRTISGLKIVFHILKVWSSPGVVRNVAVLFADNTFVLAAFHLLLLFVAIGLLLLYFYVWFLHESYFNFKFHYLHIIPEIFYSFRNFYNLKHNYAIALRNFNSF